MAPASDTDPFYILLAGISDSDPAGETASYLAVMRVDVPNKTISILNIPSAISETYDNAPESATMLRDAPYAVNEGELVRRVSSLIEQDINHYVRITDSDFVSLVDALGGLQVNVDTYVDDPTVGTIVLDPGEQTLNGEQALTYVSAKNYNDGLLQVTACIGRSIRRFLRCWRNLSPGRIWIFLSIPVELIRVLFLSSF